jgi:multiple sugar transport system permease protein
MMRNMSVDLGVAPIPPPPGHPPITTSARHGVYLIPKNARQPQLAWEFIRFAAGPEGRLVFMEALAQEQAGKAEARAEDLERRAAELRARGVADAAAKLEAEAQQLRLFKGQTYIGFQASIKAQELLGARFAPKDPLLAAAYERASAIRREIAFVPVPDTPVYGLLSDECRRAVERTLYGEVTPEQALADADRRVQAELDLYYASDGLPRLHWGYVWLVCAFLLAGAIGYWRFHYRHEGPQTSLQRTENRAGLLFISPWAIGFLVLTAGPMVFSLAMSFCSYDVIHEPRFVGLDNYSFMLLRDPLFWQSLGNTAFMVLALPLSMAFSLAIALLLNTQVKGMAAYRTIFYLPAVTPTVATAVLWYALLNPDGLINAGVRLLGIDPPSWLGDKNWSKPAIVLMGLWGAGGGMIVWLAGLQGIPQQLYEAAAIDGAGRIRRFFSITLPMLTPYIFFSFVTGVIGVFQIFAQALILTKGGPADSTLFYVYYLFNNAFRYFKMGYASAQAWILFIIVLSLTILQLRLSKRWVHYD